MSTEMLIRHDFEMAQENLIRNGSFTEGFDPWLQNQEVNLLVNEQGCSVEKAQSGSTPGIYQRLRLTGGRRYTLTIVGRSWGEAFLWVGDARHSRILRQRIRLTEGPLLAPSQAIFQAPEDGIALVGVLFGSDTPRGSRFHLREARLYENMAAPQNGHSTHELLVRSSKLASAGCIALHDRSVSAVMSLASQDHATTVAAVESLIRQVDYLFILHCGVGLPDSLMYDHPYRHRIVAFRLEEGEPGPYSSLFLSRFLRGFCLIGDNTRIYPSDSITRLIDAIDASNRSTFISVEEATLNLEHTINAGVKIAEPGLTDTIERDLSVHLSRMRAFAFHSDLLNSLPPLSVAELGSAKTWGQEIGPGRRAIHNNAGCPTDPIATSTTINRLAPGTPAPIAAPRKCTPTRSGAEVALHPPAGSTGISNQTQQSLANKVKQVVRSDEGYAPWSVIVLTYNRPELLSNLLDDLEREEERGEPIHVRIYDDASSCDYSELRDRIEERGWYYFRAQTNHGKSKFWQWITKILRDLVDIPSNGRLAFLPDDCRLCGRFFSRAWRAWSTIDDPLKIAMTVLVDSAREHQACWTSVQPEIIGEVARTQWVDGAFIAERRYLDALAYRVPPVSADRWAKNPLLSSGVGSSISRRLHADGWGLYRSIDSLIAHVGHRSEMNTKLRETEPISTVRFIDGPRRLRQLTVSEPVIASLASIPARTDALKRVIASLLPQVDHIQIYLNGWEEIPDFLLHPRIEIARSQKYSDRGDAGKFFWAPQNAGYQFVCDDDIVYPPDYVSTLINAIERYDRKAVVGLHGIVVHQRVRSYYRDRTVLHCAAELKEDRPVHMLGTGAAAWHSTAVKVTHEDFKSPNMADIWFGVVCQRQRVPAVTIARPRQWIEIIDVPDTIHRRSKGNDEVQTQVVNRASPWNIISQNRQG